jgi:hypothetical protein
MDKLTHRLVNDVLDGYPHDWQMYCAPCLEGPAWTLEQGWREGPLRKVVRTIPANMRHADPTEAYELECGHVVI